MFFIAKRIIHIDHNLAGSLHFFRCTRKHILPDVSHLDYYLEDVEGISSHFSAHISSWSAKLTAGTSFGDKREVMEGRFAAAFCQSTNYVQSERNIFITKCNISFGRISKKLSRSIFMLYFVRIYYMGNEIWLIHFKYWRLMLNGIFRNLNWNHPIIDMIGLANSSSMYLVLRFSMIMNDIVMRIFLDSIKFMKQTVHFMNPLKWTHSINPQFMKQMFLTLSLKRDRLATYCQNFDFIRWDHESNILRVPVYMSL